MNTPPMSQRAAEFLCREPERDTPFLLMDLGVIEDQYRSLGEALPGVACYFAVKSNPTPEVLCRLRRLGSRFETASIFEIRQCLSLGIPARDIHFGNPIKGESHIAEAYGLGVRSYTFDSELELEKLARSAPGSNVSCRLATDGQGAVWSLNRKFGQDPESAVRLLRRAHDLGLRAYGLSFHVGSQQRDPAAWDRAIRTAARAIEALDRLGVELRLINLGGGFPAYGYSGAHLQPQTGISQYGEAIRDAIRRHVPRAVDCVMEPGRFLCAAAGWVHSSVVLVTDRLNDGVSQRWVYVDAGRFNGLYEANDIQYPVLAESGSGPSAPCIVAGPTCDSDDVLFDRERAVQLPVGLAPGDRLTFAFAGAYTRTYAMAGMNGFPPLATYCV